MAFRAFIKIGNILTVNKKSDLFVTFLCKFGELKASRTKTNRNSNHTFGAVWQVMVQCNKCKSTKVLCQMVLMPDEPVQIS